MIDIAELENKARAATPGPWKIEYTSDDTMKLVGAPTYAGMGVKQKISEFQTLLAHVLKIPWNGYKGGRDGENNYDYIAAANPQTILALCEEIKSLRECKREALEMAGTVEAVCIFAHPEDGAAMFENLRVLRPRSQAFLEKYKERE